MSITTAVLFAAGIYLIVVAQISTTKNIKSAMIFKALPTSIGIACLILAAKSIGWL